MSVQDVIKKSFLESGAFTSINVSNAIVVLLLSLVGGLFIFAVYSRFFNGVVYSKNFGMTLVGMTVLTCMVTQAISTNVVISLGMVGALSIVRYRWICCICSGALPPVSPLARICICSLWRRPS